MNESMSGVLESRTVAITEHRFEKALRFLIARHGARVTTVQVYKYGPASDRDRMLDFIETQLSGGVTERALFRHGVTARILPKAPKLRPLADAIASDFEAIV